MEGRHAEVERRRHRHQRAVEDLAEVSHAQRPGNQGADDHGQQDRQPRDGRAAQLAQHQDDDEGQPGQADVGHAAEIRGLAVATHDPACGHWHQGQADGGDDDTGHQRREELGDPREHRGNQKTDQRGRHDCAQYPGQASTAFTAEDRPHGRHTGERHALHQRQLATEPRQSEGLQQGGEAAGKQRCGDQQADVGRAQAGRLAEDQRHGDDTAVHGQNMLQAISQVGAKAQVLVFGTLG
ncbi:hypothetical protein D3C78_884040 [compost metagenome]